MADFHDEDNDDHVDENKVVEYGGQEFRISELLAGVSFSAEEERDVGWSRSGAAEDSDSDDEEDEEEAEVQSAAPGREPTWQELLGTPPAQVSVDVLTSSVTQDGLVRKKVLRAGTGKLVSPEAKVWYHYTAFELGHSTPFDSSLLRRRPDCSNLEPPGDVIHGLRLGLKTMELYETAQFLIDFKYAYGALGCPPRVQPKATVIFNVKLLEFVDVDRKKQFNNLSRKEKLDLPFDPFLEAAKDSVANGVAQMKRANLNGATRTFHECARLLEDYSTATYKDNEARCDVVIQIRFYLANCYLERGKFPHACKQCKQGLNMDPKTRNSKLLFVYAKAKLALQGFEEALSLVEKAEKFGFDANQVARLKKEIVAAKAKEKQNEGTLYKKMFRK